jgi:hypothetical protein
MSTEDENFAFNFDDIKFTIKSNLFTAGSSSTDREVRRDFFNETGNKLDDELRNKLGLSFFQFMNKIPDVCRVTEVNGTLIIHRVTSEEGSHLDALKKGERKKSKAKKTNFFGSYRNFRPDFNRFNNSNSSNR